MKIVFFSTLAFSDSDFPLIRELQSRGLDVSCYYVLRPWKKKGGIIDVKSLKKLPGIYKASDYKDMNIYKDYLNLDKIYFINCVANWENDPRNILLRWYSFRHISNQKPDVFHITWQLSSNEYRYYNLNTNFVMTVHDPISHSGHNPADEKNRLLAFEKCQNFILLDNVLQDEFSHKYSITKDKITISRMGYFDYLNFIPCTDANMPKEKFILYFGQISKYKGIEFLVKAMEEVHKNAPNVKLVIAGKGNLYFKYKECDYIELRNYYITETELVSLLKRCLFVVCPYTDATQSGVVQTAFSLNVPTIVTNVGALPKAVTDGVTGLVVPPCNVDALATKMLYLIDNPGVLNEMKSNINDKWKTNMDWHSIGETYLNFYNKLLVKND